MLLRISAIGLLTAIFTLRPLPWFDKFVPGDAPLLHSTLCLPPTPAHCLVPAPPCPSMSKHSPLLLRWRGPCQVEVRQQGDALTQQATLKTPAGGAAVVQGFENG